MIVIGLIPLQDSPVPTVLLFTTTTRKPSCRSDYPPPSGGLCALPIAIEAPLMAPHGPADPHQFV
ncbi:TPA: hypothetical protein ACQQYL_006837, partial [Pseudomonas aeruginosa]